MKKLVALLLACMLILAAAAAMAELERNRDAVFLLEGKSSLSPSRKPSKPSIRAS